MYARTNRTYTQIIRTYTDVIVPVQIIRITDEDVFILAIIYTTDRHNCMYTQITRTLETWTQLYVHTEDTETIVHTYN